MRRFALADGFLKRACLFGVTLMVLGLGCTAYSVPPSLSNAERETVEAAKTDLVAAIKSALDRKVPQISFRLDGADQSARILLEEYASLRG